MVHGNKRNFATLGRLFWPFQRGSTVFLWQSRRWWRHKMETFYAFAGPLWWESIGHRWITPTKASDTKLWCFFNLSYGWQIIETRWFHTPSRSSWRHCNAISVAHSVFTLQINSCQDAKLVVIVSTGGCHYDNLRCHQWRQSSHMTALGFQCRGQVLLMRRFDVFLSPA